MGNYSSGHDNNDECVCHRCFTFRESFLPAKYEVPSKPVRSAFSNISILNPELLSIACVPNVIAHVCFKSGLFGHFEKTQANN